MNRRATLIFISTLMLGSAAATAEEQMATTLVKTEDGGHNVFFEYESCGGECFIGALSCNSGGGNVEIQLSDVESDVAAGIVGSEQHSFKVTAGNVSAEFNAYSLIFQEMTGSWSMASHTFGETNTLLAAIAKSKTFAAEAGTLKLELPVTEDVKTWVKRCGG